LAGIPLTADQIKIDKDNNNAFYQLVMACEDEGFSEVQQARTTSFPNGNGRQAWLNLKARFEPVDTSSRIEVFNQFQSKRLGKKEDPDKFFTQESLSPSSQDGTSRRR
jgi:hypothetical protein